MHKFRIIAVITLSVMLIFSSSIQTFATDKELVFEEQSGKMVMNSIRSEEGNWFMSFHNMLPGCTYHDALNIRNKSHKTYDLYMQSVSVDQEQLPKELLDKIYMKVYLDGKIIYDGTASGLSYEGNPALTDVILLGRYKPDSSSVIKTDLKLDDSIEIEYCNILAKVDWKFMVREIKSKDVKELVPKTGDGTPILPIAVIGMIAMIIMIITYAKRRRD